MKPNLKTYGYGIAALALLFGRYPLSWLLSSRNSNKLSPEQNPADQETYIQSPTGNILFVKSEGHLNAPPLVFIHGLNSSSEQWQHQQQHFRGSYRLISIDLPGHGRSVKVADLSIKALAIDLSTILTALKIQRPILYGHSLGGMITLEFCKRSLSPAPVAIILHGCSDSNPLKAMPISPLPSLLQRPLITPTLQYIARNSRVFTILGYVAYSSGLSALFYRFLLFTGKQSAASLRHMAAFAANTKAKTTADALLQTFEFDVRHVLKNINIPCLIITATTDRLIDPKTSLHMHRKIKGSDLVMINGGHQSLAEFPEETNTALEQFFRKHGI